MMRGGRRNYGDAAKISAKARMAPPTARVIAHDGLSFRESVSTSSCPGPVPPARPKPLRREGPGIHVLPRMPNDVDGRDKPGHDGVTNWHAHASRFLRAARFRLDLGTNI